MKGSHPTVGGRMQLMLELFGPSVIFGKDTIQAFSDRVVTEFPKEDLANEISNVLLIRKLERNSIDDECMELDRIRLYLLNRISEFGYGEHPAALFLEEPYNNPVSTSDSGQVMLDVIIPIIESVSIAQPEMVKEIVDSMNEVLSAPKMSSNWDIPEVSNQLISFIHKQLSNPELSPETRASVVQLWTHLSKARRRIDDIVDFISKADNYKFGEESMCLLRKYAEMLEEQTPDLCFLSLLIDNSRVIKVHQFRGQMGQSNTYSKGIAAKDGCVYLFDESCGFLKIGTGYGGSVYASVDAKSSFGVGQKMQTMAACSDYLVVRFGSSDDLKLLDLEDFHEMGTISNVPAGIFGAYKNVLYFLNEHVITKYKIENFTLKESGIITLITDIPLVNTSAVMIDGHSICVVSNKTIHGFSMRTGEYISNMEVTGGYYGAALDPETMFLAKIQNKEHISITQVSEYYQLTRKFRELGHDNDNVFQRMMRAGILLVIGNNNLGRKMRMQNCTAQVAEMLRNERYRYLIVELAMFLTVFGRSDNGRLISKEVAEIVMNTIQNDYVLRCEFMRSFLSIPSNSDEDVCFSLLRLMSPDEIIDAFSSGFEIGAGETSARLLLQRSEFKNVFDRCIEQPRKSCEFMTRVCSVIIRFKFEEYIACEPLVLRLVTVMRKISDKMVIGRVLPLILTLIYHMMTESVAPVEALPEIIELVNHLSGMWDQNDVLRYEEDHRKERENCPMNVSEKRIELAPGKAMVLSSFRAESATIHFAEATELNGILNIYSDKDMHKLVTSVRYIDPEQEITIGSSEVALMLRSSKQNKVIKVTVFFKTPRSTTCSSPEPVYDFTRSLVKMLAEHALEYHRIITSGKYKPRTEFIAPEYLTEIDPTKIMVRLASVMVTANITIPDDVREWSFQMIRSSEGGQEAFANRYCSQIDAVIYEDLCHATVLRAADLLRTALMFSKDPLSETVRSTVASFISFCKGSVPIDDDFIRSFREISSDLIMILRRNNFMNETCECCISEIGKVSRTESHDDIPIVSFCISMLESEFETLSNEKFIRMISECMRVNQVHSIQRIMMLVRRRNLSVPPSDIPALRSILQNIAKHVMSGPALDKDQKLPYNIVSGLSQAYLLRLMLSTDRYNELIGSLMMKEEQVGVLAVLAVGQMKMMKNMAVVMPFDGRKAVIERVDPVAAKLVDEYGIEWILPVYARMGCVPRKCNFEMDRLSPIGKVSERFMNLVLNLTSDSSVSNLAIAAVNELSFSNSVSVNDCRKLIESFAGETETPQQMRITELSKHALSIDEDTKLYQTIRCGSSFSFMAYDKLKWTILDSTDVGQNICSLSNCHLFQPVSTPEEYNVSLIGPEKQLLICMSSCGTVLTQSFVGQLTDPILCVSANDVSKFRIIDTPTSQGPSYLLHNAESKIARFSHVLYEKKLVPVNTRLELASKYHLLPAVSEMRSYFEITCSGTKTIDIYILSELVENLVEYVYKVETDSTIGVCVDLTDMYTFLVKDGKVLESGHMAHHVTSFSVQIRVREPDGDETIEINNGAFPYEYPNYNELPISGLDTWEAIQIVEAPSRDDSIRFMCKSKEQMFRKELLAWGDYDQDTIKHFITPGFCISRRGDQMRMETGYLGDIHTNGTVTMNQCNGISKTVRCADTSPLIGWLCSSPAVDMEMYNHVYRTVTSYPCEMAFFQATSDSEFDVLRKMVPIKSKERSIEAGAVLNVVSNLLSDAQILTLIPDMETFVEAAARASESVALIEGVITENISRFYQALFDNHPDQFRRLVERAGALLCPVHMKMNRIVMDPLSKSADYPYLESDIIYVSVIKCSGPVLCWGRDGMVNYELTDNVYSQAMFVGKQVGVRNEADGGVSIDVAPISFKKDKNWSFALSIVNFMIQKITTSDEIQEMLINQIMLPLYSHIMCGRTMLFLNLYGYWFTQILLSKRLTSEQMKQFNELINWDALLSIENMDINIPINLFTAFCMSNVSSDLSEVRKGIVTYVDNMLSTEYLLANRVGCEIGVALVDTTNRLSILGRVGDLPLPVVTSVSLGILHRSRMSPRTVEIDTANYVGPTASEVFRFKKKEEVKCIYVSFDQKPEENFAFDNDKTPITSDMCCNIYDDCFGIVFKTSEESRKIRVTPIRNLFRSTVIDAQQILLLHPRTKFDLRTEAMCFAIAMSIFQDSHIETISPFPDSLFASLGLTSDIEALRFRIETHLFIISRGFESVDTENFSYDKNIAEFMSGYTLARGGHAFNGALDEMEYITEGERISAKRIFQKINFAFTVIPKPLIGPYQHIMKLSHGERIRVSSIMSMAEQNMFVRPSSTANTSAMIPNSEVSDSYGLSAFTGFGKHMAWAWESGRPPILPVSRVVIRYAFGGTLIADDFADFDEQFAASNPSDEEMLRYISKFKKQLEAIRVGVLEFGVPVVAENKIFPRIVQMMPFKKIRCIEHADVSYLLESPVYTAPLREKMVRAQVKFADGEVHQLDLKAEIIRQAESEYIKKV